MKNKVTNILLIGVGGQGIIVASEIMADVFMDAGYDVKKSEIHGMAQRGGSVSTHVRFGPKVYSPLIREGEADIFVAFEELEALRYLDFLASEAVIILNQQRLNPPSVALGVDVYPENVSECLASRAKDFRKISGRETALKAGDVRALNIVLLGALSNLLNIPETIWIAHIQHRFPETAQATNIKAFQLGRGI